MLPKPLFPPAARMLPIRQPGSLHPRADSSRRQPLRASPQRAVDLDEVVGEVAERNSGDVALDSLAERVGEPGEAPDGHANRKILALHIAGADVAEIGITEHHLSRGPGDLRSTPPNFKVAHYRIPQLKWTPLSRPFFARNKLMSAGVRV